MASSTMEVDALVIGAGFYGCNIALTLRELGMGRVALVDREPIILRRASYVNQARVHNGYHYPRSLDTANRSRENFQRFCVDYGYAIVFNMEKLYAVARDSLVTPNQFLRFCREIDVRCESAPARVSKLFDASLIDAVFLAKEYAFDSLMMASDFYSRLEAAGVWLMLGVEARVFHSEEARVEVKLNDGGRIRAGYVFNCTYSNVDGVGCELSTKIKKELTEMALINPPPELEGLGVTIMDGPFFSAMPFPPEKCYSLSHVRLTPHYAWRGLRNEEPVPVKTHAEFMLRDAERFLPCMSKAKYRRSIFELKAVLERNEADDGRPILYERSEKTPRVVSVLGGKIDNIYDVLALVRSETWSVH